MFTFALALALAPPLAAPVVDEPALFDDLSAVTADDVPRMYAWPGTAIGPRFTQGGVGLGQIGVSYRLVEWLEPEAVIGIGAHAVLPTASTPIDRVQIVDRFSFGTRIIAPMEGMRPFLWVALHHEHQAEWDAMMKNPIGSTLGVSSEGVSHYTGAEAGVGTALQFRVDDNPLQAMFRVNVVYLPALGGHVLHTDGTHAALGDQLALLVDLTAGLPLRF
jgi:hypothetical protein